MRDDKDHNERLDDFSGYMRQRLEEHRLPVDAGCWDEVEARMNRKARSRGWLWTGGLAAAAVLALVIWLLPSPEKMPLEELSPFQKEISEKAEEMNILPERPVLPVEPVKKRIAKVLKWEKKAKLSAIVGEKETIREDEKCETIEIIEKDAIAAIVEEPSVKEDASEDSTDIVVKRGDSTVPLPEGERSPRRKASLKKKAKKSKRNKWLLAAAVGSSGYVDSFLNTDMSYGDASSPGDMNNSAGSPDPDKPDKDDDEKESGNTPPQTVSFRNAPVLRSSKVDENFLDNRSFESYPDVSYSLPISFGFTVRKDLSRRIAVESGLMYTYLSTTFKRGGDCPSEVKSSLHYLGIPLNLVVYLWKNQRWNVYLSGGFMMEKGLQAVNGSMARFSIYGKYLYTVEQNIMCVFDLSGDKPVLTTNDIWLQRDVETLFNYKDKMFMGTPTGMLIYSLEDPLAPKYRSSVSHVFGCDPVVVEDDLAYVTVHSGNTCGQNTNELMLIDVSDVDQPNLLVTYGMKCPKGLGIDNGTLFLCDEGLKVFNAKDPMTLLANQLVHYAGMEGYDVIPFRNTLMMIADDGLYQYDYSNLQAISQLSKLPMGE